MEVITEEEFLAKKGVGSPFSGSSLDKCRFPHGLTDKAHKRMMKEISKQDEEYYKKREQARKEYHELITKGVIRDKTNIEKTIERANGNSDNASTQAARRMCEKRGIDWRNYNGTEN